MYIIMYKIGLSNSIDNAIHHDSTRTIVIPIIDFLLSIVTTCTCTRTWCLRMRFDHTHGLCACA